MHWYLRGSCLLLLANPLLGLAQQDAPAQAATTDATEPGQVAGNLAATAAENESPARSADLAVEPAEMEAGVVAAALAPDIRRGTVGNRVMDEMDLGRTQITGNQELPTVLYIVPWKKADPGDLMVRPVNTLLDEVLAPIDRSEFIRQVGYYRDLHRQDDE